MFSQAQARTVTLDEALLSDFDALVSCGAVAKPFYGQRPWSDKIIKEALRSARTQEAQGVCAAAEIHILKERLEKALQLKEKKDVKIFIKPVEQVTLGYAGLLGGNSLYVNNRRGTVNALINSFTENSANKIRGEGHNLFFSSAHYFSWHGQDLYLEPVFGGLVADDFSQTHDLVFSFQQAYVHFQKKNISLQIGRSPVYWGQGENGGLLFTQNARPLDVVQLSNIESWRLPWVLQQLGVFKFSFVFGTLGPEQRFPWTLFSGLSLGYKPTNFLEFNLAHVFEFGGQGAPDMAVSTGLQEFFGFIPFVSQTEKRGGNKITELNFRFFVDRWMGLQGYVDYAMDDANLTGGSSALKKHFTANSSYLAGLYVTRFLGSLQDHLRVEFSYLGQIMYRHSLYADGWSINQSILGHSAGPDSYRVHSVWSHRWEEKKADTYLSFTWTKRDSNTYQVSADGFTETVRDERPSEQRYSLQTGVAMQRQPWQWRGYVGGEMIKNYKYNQGDIAFAGLLGLELNYRF